MKILSRIIKSQNGFRWLVLPFGLLLIVFWILPLVQGGLMSLQPDFPKEGREYSWLYNYERMFSDKNFSTALSNTSTYIFWTITSIIPTAITLAFILIKMTKKLRYFSAFCLLIPALIPPAIIAQLFNMIFNGKVGLLNKIFIEPFGGSPIHWMSDPKYILAAMVIQAAWRWTGFVTLFILCGLEAVPKSTSEAAELEGAGVFRRFLHIELPAIKHLIFFSIAFLFIDSFSLFSGAYDLLGPSGGTANAGLVMINYAYSANSFQEYNMAAAICFSMLPVLLLLTGLFCLKWERFNHFIKKRFLCPEYLETLISLPLTIIEYISTELLCPIRKISSRLSDKTRVFLRQSSLLILISPFITLFSYPLLWLIVSTFKTKRELYRPMQFFPETWQNNSWSLFFSETFNKEFAFWDFWNNSMLIATGQAFLAVLISSAAAYFFVFNKFRGKILIFILAISLILIPRQIMIFPLRELILDLRLHDNLWAVILPGSLSGIGILFFIQIYKSLPVDYMDMARVEGASELKTFITTIPLLSSAFLCCFMIHFLLAWQQHLIPNQLLNENQILPVAMNALSSYGGGNRYPPMILLICALFCIIPSLLIFLFTYRKFRSALSKSIC